MTLAALLAALAAVAPLAAQEVALRPGIWRAWLDSPGGELPFQLELRADGEALTAVIHNGAERVPFPEARLAEGTLVLAMPHYDSTITATLAESGERLDGEWVKRGSGDSWTRMAFHASWCIEDRSDEPGYEGCRFVDGERFVAHQTNFTGRWRVDFESGSGDLESDEVDAVAIIEGSSPFDVRGTFLTPLGDYRFLAGDSLCALGDASNRPRLRLSCFDGAHAFLFSATWSRGRASGDFWSRDTWHETWTAVRDDQAALPDAFELTRWDDEVPLASLHYPDLDGVERSLGGEAFAGKARLLQLFGTWCPNCNDEAPYLAELDRRYRARGLSIVGLAFEHTGAFERDAEQVRRYAKLYGIEYPLLLAGTSDKQSASARFPLIDRVRAFPTTLFLRADGSVRAIHTGFAGPATGAEHVKLRADFERLIEELLSDARRGEAQGEQGER